jgi:hypothetical protein
MAFFCSVVPLGSLNTAPVTIGGASAADAAGGSRSENREVATTAAARYGHRRPVRPRGVLPIERPNSVTSERDS